MEGLLVQVGQAGSGLHACMFSTEFSSESCGFATSCPPPPPPPPRPSGPYLLPSSDLSRAPSLPIPQVPSVDLNSLGSDLSRAEGAVDELSLVVQVRGVLLIT